MSQITPEESDFVLIDKKTGKVVKQTSATRLHAAANAGMRNSWVDYKRSTRPTHTINMNKIFGQPE